jgi:DNA-directed RNA polymerase subunit N (RpoN/RPB10)
MFYMTCPSCGKFLGIFIEELDKLEQTVKNNRDITEEKKSEEISKYIKSIHLRMCCNMRLFSRKDFIEVITKN